MGGINTSRWLAGGVVAAIIIWLIEGAASVLYMDDMQTALEAHGLAMEMTASVWAFTVVVCLISGLTLIFFYAAARPRFGPGPKTALIAAFWLWLGSYVLSLVGYHMMGLYPDGMLVLWGVVGLVERSIAAVAGAWVYREGPAAG